MGLFKKKIVKKTYDREHMKPVIRASICTGEEVAGFKDIRTGKIEEIMLIRSPEDLEKFKEIYEITEEILAYIKYAGDKGCFLTGTQDLEIKNIMILDE